MCSITRRGRWPPCKAGGARLVVEHPTYPFENGKRSSLLRMPVFAYNAHVFRRLEPMIDLYALIGDPCEGTLNGRPCHEHPERRGREPPAPARPAQGRGGSGACSALASMPVVAEGLLTG